MRPLALVLSFLSGLTFFTLALKYHGGFTADAGTLFGGVGNVEQTILSAGSVNHGHT
jgi:hypothetical protein